MKIAHCMHLVLDYERNTDNSKDKTHYHECDTANSRRRTPNYGGKREYFVHNTTNHRYMTHHYEHSKLNYETNTVNFQSQRTNSRQKTTNIDYDS